MSYIVIHENGKVVETRPIKDGLSVENIAVIDSVPALEHKDGFNAFLCYNEADGLYWGYVEAPERDELTDSQALYILTGGEYGEA